MHEKGRLDIGMRLARVLIAVAVVSGGPLWAGPLISYGDAVEGLVIDAATGDPVEGAIVKVQWYAVVFQLVIESGSTPTGAPAIAVTDAKGYYKIRGRPLWTTFGLSHGNGIVLHPLYDAASLDCSTKSSRNLHRHKGRLIYNVRLNPSNRIPAQPNPSVSDVYKASFTVEEYFKSAKRSGLEYRKFKFWRLIENDPSIKSLLSIGDSR